MSLIDCIGVMQNSFERDMPIFAVQTGQQQQQQAPPQQAPVNYLQQSPMPSHAQQAGFQFGGYALPQQQSPYASPLPPPQGQQPAMNQQPYYAQGQPQYQADYQQQQQASYAASPLPQQPVHAQYGASPMPQGMAAPYGAPQFPQNYGGAAPAGGYGYGSNQDYLQQQQQQQFQQPQYQQMPPKKTEEQERAEMIEAIRAKVEQEKLQEQQRIAEETDRLILEGSTMTEHSQRLEKAIERVQVELLRAQHGKEELARAVQAVIVPTIDIGTIDVASVLQPMGTAPEQLLTSTLKIHAINDVLYAVTKATLGEQGKPSVNLQDSLKHIRALAREQFMAKMLVKKIRRQFPVFAQHQ